jgi:hypothetical protein
MPEAQSVARRVSAPQWPRYSASAQPWWPVSSAPIALSAARAQWADSGAESLWREPAVPYGCRPRGSVPRTWPRRGRQDALDHPVKAGHVSVPHVRDLRGVLDRERAEIGVLISLEYWPDAEESGIGGLL